MMSCRILVYFLLVYLCKAAVLPQNLHEYKVFMPKISPQEDDEYWCYATEVPKETQYIVKYEAVAKGNIAHHMLIYGCNKPAHTGQAWQCGDICGDDESGSIMFAWARNAPPTKLPEDVGFEIGEHAKVNYIVVQIHYRRGFTDQDPPDESGLSFATTAQPQKYRAGILLMVTGSIYVPSHSHNVHADISCKFDGKSPIYPFGFRVHAHSLSTVISGYQYNGSWHLMGKGNPQWPQAFYPMDNNIVIKHGDILGGRCTYDSDLDVNTHVGSTHIDEMCNFYMMYYTNADKGKSFYECFGNDFEKKLESLPAGNDVPLPPNPLLEDEGNGHHHHHGMTTEHKLNDESTEQAQETNADVEQDQYEPLQGIYQIKSRDYHPQSTNRYLRRGGANYPRGIRRNWGPYAPREQHYSNPYIYDYGGNQYSDSVGGGAGSNNYDFRDFYDEVKNQRSRIRRPPSPPSGQEEKPHQSGQSHFVGDLNLADSTRTGIGQNRASGSGSSSRLYNHIGDGSQSNPTGVHTGTSYSDGSRLPSQSKVSSGSLSSSLSSGIPGSTVSPMTHNRGVVGDGFSASLGSNRASSPAIQPHQLPKSGTSVELVPDWPSIQPDDHLVLGQVAGMHTDSKGNLHIFHRGSRMWDGGSFDLNNQFRGSSPISENTIITFDQSGKVLKQWGEDRFYMPHGLYIDKEDNIWVTDVALHQVMRFKSGSSEPDLVIGDKLQPGNHKSQFCKPADVIVLSTGDILVADGYCHARIAKFSNEGKFIKDWGKPSKKVLSDGFPPPSTFSLPHSLVELEKHKAVCVADRENGRIQCFDYDGHFIKQIHPKEFGSTVFAVTYCPDKDVLYVVNGPDPYSNDAHATGFTIDYNTGKLLGTWAPSDKGFSRPHDLTVANEGRDLYVGEIGPNKVWKFNVNMDKVLADSHQTMKRPGAHPAQTVDNSSEELTEDKLERSEEPDFGVSIVIGSLLVIPVLVIIIIVVFLRVRKRCQFSLTSLKEYKYRRNRRFNLGEFFGRHKGFDRVNTEDNDELDHLNSDSDDVEEYSATSSHKA